MEKAVTEIDAILKMHGRERWINYIGSDIAPPNSKYVWSTTPYADYLYYFSIFTQLKKIEEAAMGNSSPRSTNAGQ